jgi:5-formyltetrahydrofolate cyclo-ligase
MTEADKSDLRREFRVRRQALMAAQPEAASQAAEAFMLAPRFGPVHVAAIYHAAGSELDAEPLAAVLEGQGARIALPVVVARDTPLIFRLRDHQPRMADALGMFSPPPTAPVVTPDLIVAPLLAFDSRGGRLGQGGGFYDRTLADLRARGQVWVLGLAYAGQEAERIPMVAHDEKLDGVLTEAGLRWFTRDV